jgi:hypothetical protein
VSSLGDVSKMHLGMARTAAKAIKSWRSEPKDEDFARKVEAGVLECLPFPAVLELVAKDAWQALLNIKRPERLPRLREALRGMFQTSIELLQYLCEQADELGAAGYPVSTAGQLNDAHAEARRLHHRTMKAWDMIDENLIAEAKRLVRRKEWPTAGQALEDLIAAREAAGIAPSYEELLALADRSPPPAEWFTADEPKPF